MGEREQLRQIARGDEAAGAGRRLTADDLVNLELGADVDALGRFVEEKDLRVECRAIWRRRSSAGCRRSGCRGCASMSRALIRQVAGSPPPPAARVGRGRSRSPRRAACGSTRLWRTVRLKKRPCRWRSSGTSAIPARAAARGEPRALDPILHPDRHRCRPDGCRRSSRAARIDPSRRGRTARRSRQRATDRLTSRNEGVRVRAAICSSGSPAAAVAMLGAQAADRGRPSPAQSRRR